MMEKPLNIRKNFLLRNNDDKIPPQSIDAEKVVLGAIIIESQILPAVHKYLRAEHFYKEDHQIIYRACESLLEENKALDLIILADKLKSIGMLDQIGGPYALSVLTNDVANTSNTMHHCFIIIEKFMLREVIRLTRVYSNKAFEEGNPFKLITDFKEELDNLDSYTTTIVTMNAKSAVESAMASVNKVMTGNYKTYYDTGYPSFDDKVSISGNEILMIAGPAGHGKTKFVIGLMYKLLSRHNDIAVDWFSFEDPKEKIVRAMIAAETGFTDKYLKGKTRSKISVQDHAIVKQLSEKISKFDIEFHEDPISAKDIRYSFTRFCEKRPGKLNICIIDNLLLVPDRARGSERDDNILAEVSKMRQGTKGLIIPVHHFLDDQQSSDRAKLAYRPRLKDMKGSEAYRRVPTQILLINKPGEYNDIVKLYPDKKEFLKSLFITDLAKNRDGDTDINGEQGLIRWFANLDFNIFYEY